jgi:hypothetical protein
MHPEPAAGALQGVGRQLFPNLVAGERAVPPWTDAEQRVFKDKRGAIGRNVMLGEVHDPFCHFFPSQVARIEVVISGADDNLGLFTHQLNVFADDNSLGPALDKRAQIKMVPGDDHQIKIACHIQHPIKLRQGIVQVGNDKASHVKFPS